MTAVANWTSLVFNKTGLLLFGEVIRDMYYNGMMKETSHSERRDDPSSYPQERFWWLEFGPTQSALFRIFFGVTLLINLWIRVRGGQLDLFYTNEGLLPLHLINTSRGWSFLYSFNTPLLARVGFLLIVLCYLSYTFGIFLRITKWLVVLCLLSLYHRAPTLDDGSDWTLRLWAIWTAFLPLGRKWSVDAHYAKKFPFLNESSNPLAAILLSGNLAFSYLFNCLQKESAAWKTGEAGRYILSDPAAVSQIGVWVREGGVCEFLPILTKGSVVIEVILFFSILLSCRLRVAGYVTALGMLLMHGFLGIVLSIGTFPIAYCALALLYLPLKSVQDTTPRSGALTLTPSYIVGILSTLAFAWYSIILFLHFNPLIPTTFKSFPLPGKAFILDSARNFFMIPQEWFMFRYISSEGITVSASLVKDGEESWDPARRRKANHFEVATEGTRLGKYWNTYLTRLRFQDFSRMREYFANFFLAQGYDRVEVVEVKAFASKGCGLKAPPPVILPLFSLNRMHTYPLHSHDLRSAKDELSAVVDQSMEQYGSEWKNSTQVFGVFGQLGQSVTFTFNSPLECNAEVFLDRAVARDFADISVSINDKFPSVHLAGSTHLGVLREQSSLGIHSIKKGTNILSISFQEGLQEGRTRFGLAGVQWRCK